MPHSCPGESLACADGWTGPMPGPDAQARWCRLWVSVSFAMRTNITQTLLTHPFWVAQAVHLVQAVANGGE